MEGARQKVLDKLREQSIPSSQLFQEFLVEYELLSEYQLLQVIFFFLFAIFIFPRKTALTQAST